MGTEAVTYISQRFASLAAFFYLISLVLYVKSRSVSKKAVNADPDNAEAYYGLGYVSYNLGRFDEASEYLDTALKLNPDYDGAAYMAGLCALKLGKADNAKEYFKKTLLINPGHAPARKTLQSIETP